MHLLRTKTITYIFINLYFQLKAFGKQHPNLGSGTRAFAQTIENTMANIKWMKENYEIVSEWLNHYKN